MVARHSPEHRPGMLRKSVAGLGRNPHLTNEECHCGMDFEVLQVADDGERERVLVKCGSRCFWEPVTNCDWFSASALARVRRKLKSSEKRSILRWVAWFSTLVEMP